MNSASISQCCPNFEIEFCRSFAHSVSPRAHLSVDYFPELTLRSWNTNVTEIPTISKKPQTSQTEEKTTIGPNGVSFS